MTTETKELTEFTFAIPLNEENLNLLQELGFDRRSGSCSYTYNWFVVVPLKMWYYPVECYYGIKLGVSKEVIEKFKLLVDYPKN